MLTSHSNIVLQGTNNSNANSTSQELQLDDLQRLKEQLCTKNTVQQHFVDLFLCATMTTTSFHMCSCNQTASNKKVECMVFVYYPQIKLDISAVNSSKKSQSSRRSKKYGSKAANEMTNNDYV